MSGFGQPPGGQPPGGGGFGQPPGGGGFGQPPGGGGFGQPPAGGGGFGQPPAGPAGGGFGAPPPTGGGSAAAASKVAAPAITLMILNGIGIALALVGLLMNILGAGLGAASAAGSDQQMANMLSGGVGIVTNILGLAVGGFCIFGLLKMKSLNSWGLSLAAVILGAIPCLGPCWCLGLPVGIWGLVVLLDEEVKSSFS